MIIFFPQRKIYTTPVVQFNEGLMPGCIRTNSNLNLNRPATVESFQIVTNCKTGGEIVQGSQGEEWFVHIVLLLPVHGFYNLRGIVTS